MSHTLLGPGREFDLIRSLLDRWGSAASGIGDDAAVLSLAPGERLVASTDTSVEDVHFRRAWLTPEEIGWRATMAALSDLAAMGARPLGALVALTVPDAWRDVLPGVADGVGAACARAGLQVVGGDTNAGAVLTIGITVLGATATPLMRAGARTGDAVWVTGELGGPGAALAAWQGGAAPGGAYRERFARPEARLAQGRQVAAAGATACIDISDGLIADARHLAAASLACVTIDLDRVPCVHGVTPQRAATSGEEYELLFTAPRGVQIALDRVPATVIGEVTSVGAAAVVVTQGGALVEGLTGHDHFSR